jgi:hypothetical protein
MNNEKKTFSLSIIADQFHGNGKLQFLIIHKYSSNTFFEMLAQSMWQTRALDICTTVCTSSESIKLVKFHYYI